MLSQKLTPVDLATITTEGSATKKSWGAIPPVVAQPIGLKKSQPTSKAVVTPKSVASKTVKTPLAVEVASKSAVFEGRRERTLLDIDKSGEVASLLKSANQVTRPTVKPVINFSSLPTLGESVRTKGKH